MYLGPIEVGMQFLWEPMKPHATEHMKVIQTNVNGDGELWITTRSWVAESKISGDYVGTTCWNDESRFREAVILVTDSPDEDEMLRNTGRDFTQENSRNWSDNPDINLMFFRCQENWCNQLLISRGHVFLNDVYDSLGFERTPVGAICGWLYEEQDSDGNEFIYFGIPDAAKNAPEKLRLEFNVQGVIYDRI